jgi:hypothetical protein
MARQPQVLYLRYRRIPATPLCSQQFDKEMIDTNHDGQFDFQVFLSSIPNGTAHSNEYVPFVVNLKTNTATQVPFPYETNVLDPAITPDGNSLGGKDTNAFNNSAVLVPVPANMLTQGNGQGAPTAFDYAVVTFDRIGDEVDETPVLQYDAANPGFNVQGGQAPFARSAWNEHPTVQLEELNDAARCSGLVPGIMPTGSGPMS